MKISLKKAAIVDSDPTSSETARGALEKRFPRISIVCFSSIEELAAALPQSDIELIITDIHVGGKEHAGFEIMKLGWSWRIPTTIVTETALKNEPIINVYCPYASFVGKKDDETTWLKIIDWLTSGKRNKNAILDGILVLREKGHPKERDASIGQFFGLFIISSSKTGS